MEDLTFKPAGAALVAVVAALAPAAQIHPAGPQGGAMAQETAAREALAAAAAKLGPATPFGELSTGADARMAKPAKGQLGLPFEE